MRIVLIIGCCPRRQGSRGDCLYVCFSFIFPDDRNPTCAFSYWCVSLFQKSLAKPILLIIHKDDEFWTMLPCVAGPICGAQCLCLPFSSRNDRSIDLQSMMSTAQYNHSLGIFTRLLSFAVCATRGLWAERGGRWGCTLYVFPRRAR